MKFISEEEQELLIKSAIDARSHAYAPYSEFRVGAALLADNGLIYCGANIENASYGATNCAERTALFKAVYDGCREFSAIAISCSGEHFPYPCGICMQALSEFCSPAMQVILVNNGGELKQYRFSDLLPHGFSGKDME